MQSRTLKPVFQLFSGQGENDSEKVDCTTYKTACV